jgi:hypothetical protein
MPDEKERERARREEWEGKENLRKCSFNAV